MGSGNQFPDVDEHRIRQILAERVEVGPQPGEHQVNSDEATVAVIDALQTLDIPYILVG